MKQSKFNQLLILLGILAFILFLLWLRVKKDSPTLPPQPSTPFELLNNKIKNEKICNYIFERFPKIDINAMRDTIDTYTTSPHNKFHELIFNYEYPTMYTNGEVGLSGQMEVEFSNNTGDLIETEYQEIPIRCLPDKIRNALYKKFPDKANSFQVYELEITASGNIYYEFDFDLKTGIDITFNEAGQLLKTNGLNNNDINETNQNED